MPKAGGEVRNLRARGKFASSRVDSRFPVALRKRGNALRAAAFSWLSCVFVSFAIQTPISAGVQTRGQHPSP